jgi:hypothetical protein
LSEACGDRAFTVIPRRSDRFSVTDTQTREDNEAGMQSKAAYVIVGVLVVALSFGATLFALNLWSGNPTTPGTSESSAPSSASATTRDTTLAELPKLGASGFIWYSVRGLNVQPVNDTPVVRDQQILQLIATPNDNAHSLVARYRGLNKNQVYRVTSWVKSQAGGNVEIAALDQPDGNPVNNGDVIFDPSSKTFLSAAGVKARGFEQGPDNWQKVWLDIATSDGQFLVAIRAARGDVLSFKGDGTLGLILGGIQVAPSSG